jgi:hypothetical protein
MEYFVREELGFEQPYDFCSSTCIALKDKVKDDFE